MDNTGSRLAGNHATSVVHILPNGKWDTQCGTHIPVFGSPLMVLSPYAIGFAKRADNPWTQCRKCFGPAS